MNRHPAPEILDPRPSKRPRLENASHHTPSKSSPSVFATPDGFAKSSKRPKARIHSEPFTSGFVTTSDNSKPCGAAKKPPPVTPLKHPMKPPSGPPRRTLQPLKPSAFPPPFFPQEAAQSPAQSKKQLPRLVDLNLSTPVKSSPSRIPITPITTSLTPRRPVPLPPPCTVKPSPRLKVMVAPPAPVPETPPNFRKTILTTMMARTTDPATAAGSAEVASLLLQSHAVIPYKPLPEEERGLHRSPSKKDGKRPEKYVSGGLAARAALLVSRTQASVALWQTDMERQIDSAAKLASAAGKPTSTIGKPVSTTGKPLSNPCKPVSRGFSKSISTPCKPISKLVRPSPVSNKPTSTTGKPVATPLKPASESARPTPMSSKPATSSKPSSTSSKPVSMSNKPSSRGGPSRLVPDLRLLIKRVVQAPMPAKSAYAGNLPSKWATGIALCQILPKSGSATRAPGRRRSHGGEAGGQRGDANPHTDVNLVVVVFSFNAREEAAYDVKRIAMQEAAARKARRATVREGASFQVGREVLVWQPFSEQGLIGGRGLLRSPGVNGCPESPRQERITYREPPRAPQPPPFAFMDSSQSSGPGSQMQSSQSEEEEEGVDDVAVPERTLFCTRFVILPESGAGEGG